MGRGNFWYGGFDCWLLLLLLFCGWVCFDGGCCWGETVAKGEEETGLEAVDPMEISPRPGRKEVMDID